MKMLSLCFMFIFGFIVEPPKPKTKGGYTDPLIEITKAYFKIYNQHQVDPLVAFYSADAEIEDRMMKYVILGQDQIKAVIQAAFEGESNMYKEIHFQIEKILQDGQQVVVEGEMQKIKIGEDYQNWKFVSWFDFNKKGKIKRQQDYVIYPCDLLQKNRK